MTDTSRKTVEKLAKTADLFAKAMKAWQHKTQKHNEDVRDTLLALRAEVDALEAKQAEAEANINLKADFIDATLNDCAALSQQLEEAKAERVTVKPLVEAMEDLLGEARGVLPESADAFYDYKRGEFTEARILSAITTAPITPAEAARDALISAAYHIEKRAEEIIQKHLSVPAFNELRDVAKGLRAIAQEGNQ